nr:hypothetical protein [Sphingosinicella soli]
MILPLAAPLLPACIARTAVDIVTLPVKAVGAGVDAVTTSQSEADEKRGREIRKQEERIGKARRKCDAARKRGEYDEKWCPIAAERVQY